MCCYLLIGRLLLVEVGVFKLTIVLLLEFQNTIITFFHTLSNVCLESLESLSVVFFGVYIFALVKTGYIKGFVFTELPVAAVAICCGLV